MANVKHSSYSQQFKIDAVKLITEQGYKMSEAARNLGVHSSMLKRWKKQLEAGGANGIPGKRHLSPEAEELQKLRKRVKQLEMEREILKKATAFFAKASY